VYSDHQNNLEAMVTFPASRAPRPAITAPNAS